ncbi:MAG: hypothetical protein JO292_09555 [Betaproteobacteria bacterium]|nr:hypothetical protein [Betaproteobacteria bacterium]
MRALAAATVAAAALSIIFVLDLTKYPDLPGRLFIFRYLLRSQDVAGSILVIAIAVGALLPRTRSRVLELIDALSRHAWPVAGVTFVFLCAATWAVTRQHALAGDEHLALFQSRVFAAGHLTGHYPPELIAWLVPPWYESHWLVASQASGAVASIYWPGFALLLAPFSLLGIPWACNPLLASLSLVLIAKLAARLTANAQAGGWAMLFALGSPGFTAMALSYFSMTAHLLLNLAFAWLVLAGGTRRLIAAGVVGSVALVQSNPVPHMLFAAPWIVWIARSAGARRNLLALAGGYAPLSLGLGLGWWLFLRELQGPQMVSPYPEDTSLPHRLANLAWYLLLELRASFSVSSENLELRLSEQVRLWSWAVPGLPLVAAAGWWLNRRSPGLNLFAAALATTLAGYCLVSYAQGYGWGARYVHPAWSALPILASAAMVSLQPGSVRLGSYVARMTLLSLVFATALRFFQIRLFMDEVLALTPPFESGRRQIVFIAPNAEYYTQDLVQNDPFLRDPVIFMLSRGFNYDYESVIQRRYPGARLTHAGPTGYVWRLPDAPAR